MDRQERQIRLNRAKSTDIVSYLASKGIHPANAPSLYAYYFSPIKAENNPSMCVNLVKNTWRLFNEDNKFGDVLDLCMLIEDCSLPKAINILLGETDTDTEIKRFEPLSKERVSDAIKIEKVSVIDDNELLRYISGRRLDIDIVKLYYKELHISFPNSKKDPYRTHVVMGLKNDSGGYDMRNHYLKLGNSPKTITTLRNTGDELYFFEGGLNYVALLTYFNLRYLPGTTVILNGTGQAGAVADFFSGKHCYYWGDNDEAGDRVVGVLEEKGIIITDCRRVYENYSDFNDKLMGVSLVKNHSK